MVIKLKVNTDYEITVKRSGEVRYDMMGWDGYSGVGKLRPKEKIHFRP